MAEFSRVPIWKNVTKEQWIDWKWQVGHCISTLEELEQVVTLTQKQKEGVEQATRYLKMRITPHIALMMSEGKENDTLRRQFIPSVEEVRSATNELLYSDVNDDDGYSPMRGLVHRYPTKVLVFPSNYCGCYCRYCFRRKLKRDIEDTLTRDNYTRIFEYLKNHPLINEVIFSGGDPLVVNDEIFDFILTELAKIDSIKIVRFHTRMVITVPYRITDAFVSMLNKYKKRFAIYVVIHIDTIRELSAESKNAVDKLVNNGILCFASCPLLHGINDDEKTLADLWNGLVENRVKPYYLFQSDPVQGLGHFLVPLSRGLELTRNLYDRISGLAMPLYCFNVPNGGGHVLITYPYIKQVGEHEFELTNFEGKVTHYTELSWEEGEDE